jgi:hypothetical protein
MRNRELIVSKLEQTEGKLKTLLMMVKMGQPIEDFLRTIGEAEELVQETKEYINREPINYAQ